MAELHLPMAKTLRPIFLSSVNFWKSLISSRQGHAFVIVSLHVVSKRLALPIPS